MSWPRTEASIFRHSDFLENAFFAAATARSTSAFKNNYLIKGM